MLTSWKLVAPRQQRIVCRKWQWRWWSVSSHARFHVDVYPHLGYAEVTIHGYVKASTISYVFGPRCSRARVRLRGLKLQIRTRDTMSMSSKLQVDWDGHYRRKVGGKMNHYHWDWLVRKQSCKGNRAWFLPHKSQNHSLRLCAVLNDCSVILRDVSCEGKVVTSYLVYQCRWDSAYLSWDYHKTSDFLTSNGRSRADNPFEYIPWCSSCRILIVEGI